MLQSQCRYILETSYTTIYVLSPGVVFLGCEIGMLGFKSVRPQAQSSVINIKPHLIIIRYFSIRIKCLLEKVQLMTFPLLQLDANFIERGNPLIASHKKK